MGPPLPPPPVPIRSLRDAVWRPGWAGLSRVFEPFADLAIPWSNLPDWPDAPTLTHLVAAAAHPAPTPMLVPQVRPRRGRPPPGSLSYDQHIVERGEVPTRRHHWHDVMNALVWAAFPLAKYALHTRQARAAQAGQRRNDGAPELDAVAMLDEGGALLMGPPAVLDPLEPALRVPDRRPVAEALERGHCRLWTFGHGILESVLLRGALMSTHALTVTLRVDALPASPLAQRALADRRLAELLTAESLPFIQRPRPSIELDEGLVSCGERL